MEKFKATSNVVFVIDGKEKHFDEQKMSVRNVLKKK